MADLSALENLTKVSSEEAKANLKTFISHYETIFELPEEFRRGIKDCVCHIGKFLKSSSKDTDAVVLGLRAIRILSREKRDVDQTFPKEFISDLAQFAGLLDSPSKTHKASADQVKIIVEASKVLCNLLYHGEAVRRYSTVNGTMEGLLRRLKIYTKDLSDDIKLYDQRMLFLITVYCVDVRHLVRKELSLYCEYFEHLLKRTPKYLSPIDAEIVHDCLKVLYNATVHVEKPQKSDEEKLFYRLVGILRDLLVRAAGVEDSNKRVQLVGSIAHLLSNMPRSAIHNLVVKATPAEIEAQAALDTAAEHQLHTDETSAESGDQPREPPITEPSEPAAASNEPYKKRSVFLDHNVEALNVLLDYLIDRLENTQRADSSQAPILVCLSEACRGDRVVRKYMRACILPPLKDVMSRPEEGNTLRNRLVRLMTSPITETKYLVADFLFVLCKERVGRLIKYTGYGNAAGLLASRGLMLGGKGEGHFSSQSEDSDTEEYIRYKEGINPVLGCYEEPRPSPLEGMTDEQKEREAMDLVNLMDQLTRGGVVRPCRVGADGKPHPIDHVLELRDPAEGRENNLTESESD